MGSELGIVLWAGDGQKPHDFDQLSLSGQWEYGSSLQLRPVSGSFTDLCTTGKVAALAQDTATKALQSSLAHLRSGKAGLLLLSLDVVSNHPTVICGQEDVVVSGAVIVAGAHPDEHHLPLEEVPLGAAELHVHGAGQEWGAAAPVRAAATEPGPVGLGAGAS